MRGGWGSWAAAGLWLLAGCGAGDDGGGDPPSAGSEAPVNAGPMMPVAGLGGGMGGAGGMAGSTMTGSAGAGIGGAGGMVAPVDAGVAGRPSDAGTAVPDATTAVPDAGTDAGGEPQGEPDAATMPDSGMPDDGAGGRGEQPVMSPVYRVALRVHRGDSALAEDALLDVLDEMNWIWWSQASVCFEIEIVDDDATMQTGFDIWFHRSEIPCSPGANGVFCGDHDIHTLDRPSLGRTDNAEWDTEHDPSRTSAHELGHGLNLDHYNGFADSNDSLMSSGRQGFKLHDSEIETARNRARSKALSDTAPLYCGAPKIAP